ncbi:anaphase-promoting complex subunit cdh1-like isoform X2 [Hydractinia symbiolongicarpus]|uniref:anaphase-promoting complex subunit cdh1-like isoform X2 n=1 Tax=Hydractinia symbiolongicarpus TaxID=13093 RepID=UPI002550824D|nr:anaphase-promoting complex subunit cdh1-like isoform X2 [Hydractinia symbiolongicarpus]
MFFALKKKNNDDKQRLYNSEEHNSCTLAQETYRNYESRMNVTETRQANTNHNYKNNYINSNRDESTASIDRNIFEPITFDAPALMEANHLYDTQEENVKRKPTDGERFQKQTPQTSASNTPKLKHRPNSDLKSKRPPSGRRGLQGKTYNSGHNNKYDIFSEVAEKQTSNNMSTPGKTRPLSGNIVTHAIQVKAEKEGIQNDSEHLLKSGKTRPPSGKTRTIGENNQKEKEKRPPSGINRPVSGKERPSSAVNRKSIPSRKDSLLSLHGGSSHEDEGLYGKAEDEDLERKFMTPKRGRTPSVTDTKKDETFLGLDSMPRTPPTKLMDEAKTMETKAQYEKNAPLPPVRTSSRASLKHRKSSDLTAEVLPPINVGRTHDKNVEKRPTPTETTSLVEESAPALEQLDSSTTQNAPSGISSNTVPLSDARDVSIPQASSTTSDKKRPASDVNRPSSEKKRSTSSNSTTVRPTSTEYGAGDYTSTVTYEKRKKVEEDIPSNGLPQDDYSEGSDDELKRVMTRIDNVYDPLGSIPELKNDKNNSSSNEVKKKESPHNQPINEPVEIMSSEGYSNSPPANDEAKALENDAKINRNNSGFFETTNTTNEETNEEKTAEENEDKPNILSSVISLKTNHENDTIESGVDNNGFIDDELTQPAFETTTLPGENIEPLPEDGPSEAFPDGAMKNGRDEFGIGEGSYFTGSPFSGASEEEGPHIELPRKPKWHPPWQLKQEILAHTDAIPVLIIDPTNRWFATGSSDKTVRMWDINNGRRKLVIKAHKQAVRAMTFGIAGHRHLYTSADDRQLYCHDVEINRITNTFKGQAAVIYSMCMYPPSHLLITGGRDKLVKLYDTRTTKCVKTLRGHQNTASCVVAAEQTRQIVSGSHDGTLRVWDIGEGRCIKVLQGHNKSVRALAQHPEGATVLSASSERIIAWELPTGDMIQEIQAEDIAINSVTINHHGVTVAGGSNGVIHMWDFNSGHRFQKINRSKVYDSQEVPICVFATKFDHTGTKLICSDACNVVKVYREAYTRVRPNLDVRYVQPSMEIPLGKNYQR